MLPFRVNLQSEPKKYIFRINDSKFSFIINPKAFYDFLEHNNLETKISHVLGAINSQNPESGKKIANFVKDLILNADFPKNLLSEILIEYKKFGGLFEGKEVHVSLLKDETPSKVKGDSALLHKIKEKWTSLFLPHPTFDNPSIVIQVNSPIIKKLRELKEAEEKVEEKLGSIIHNSHYTST